MVSQSPLPFWYRNFCCFSWQKSRTSFGTNSSAFLGHGLTPSKLSMHTTVAVSFMVPNRIFPSGLNTYTSLILHTSIKFSGGFTQHLQRKLFRFLCTLLCKVQLEYIYYTTDFPKRQIPAHFTFLPKYGILLVLPY